MKKKRIRKLDRSSALSYAYLLLSYRERSESEIMERLNRRGCPGSVIADVISELKELNYLDDRKFANSWLKWRKESRPRSRALIRWELLAKGVKEEVISEALDAAYPRREEVEIARRLAGKRAELPGADRRKTYAYLKRKGFSSDVISQALEYVKNKFASEAS